MARGFTHDEYVSKFNEKWQGRKEVISEYKGFKKPIKIMCHDCGNEYIRECARDAIRYECPNCPKLIQNQSTEEFEQKLKDKCNGKYTLIGEYNGMKERTWFRCNICGFEFRMRPDDVMYRKAYEHSCEYTARRIEVQEEKENEKVRREERLKEQLKEFEEEKQKFYIKVKDIWKDEFELMSEYKGKSKKIKIRHKTCGMISNKEANSLLNGHGCKYCAVRGDSSGVIMISKILNELEYKYEREVTFDKCRYKHVLPFDFAVYANDGDLLFLIEYDGEQHYRPTKRFGGASKFKLIQLRDNIKNEYCNANDIPLLRIKFDLVERTDTPYENVREEVIEFINYIDDSKAV